MVVNQISEALQKRRIELVDMLENNRDSLNLEKQHQVYGAINELDLFLHTLDYYQKNYMGGEEPLRLVKPPEESDSQNVFSRIFSGIKDKVKRN
jgi:hypothetical protein